jgi:hypothetical protein
MLNGMVGEVVGILIYPQLTKMGRSQWPRGLTRGSAVARLLVLQVRIAGSNPSRVVDVCLLCAVRYRSLRRADNSSRRVVPGVVCLSVLMKPRQKEGPGPLGAVEPWYKYLISD